MSVGLFMSEVRVEQEADREIGAVKVCAGL